MKQRDLFEYSDPLRDVGPGWAPLVRPLLDQARQEGVEVLQVKEKFGGLRFYVSGGSDALRENIALAEAKSFTVCEECGAVGHVRKLGSWLKTLCDEHEWGAL